MTQNEQDEKSLIPAMEKVRRKMIRLQIVSGSVMFLSLMAVFGAIVYKAVAPAKQTPSAQGHSTPAFIGGVPSDGLLAATASLPPGFVIETVTYSIGDLFFYGRIANGTRKAMVFNVAAGRFVTDVTIDAR